MSDTASDYLDSIFERNDGEWYYLVEEEGSIICNFYMNDEEVSHYKKLGYIFIDNEEELEYYKNAYAKRLGSD